MGAVMMGGEEEPTSSGLTWVIVELTSDSVSSIDCLLLEVVAQLDLGVC